MKIALKTKPGADVISVTELNRMVRALLDETLPLTWVAGELSNFTRAPSGHWYFSLKDANAQVQCVMFRHKQSQLEFRPEAGMQVEVRALATLYEPRGVFQLNVETMRRAGLGALYEAFERLKAMLEKEGMFDAGRKKPIPFLPRQIGIVTSLAAAALHDVLTTLGRRMPSIPVVLYPAPVQGEGAGARLAAAIAAAGARGECDVLILARGGGSIEDLWAFNEEVLARAIAASPIPVISGIGHETDFTIADFVADRRAPTPTAAAEMASPDRAELLSRLANLGGRAGRMARRILELRMQRLDFLSRRLTHPGERVKTQQSLLDHLARRLRANWSVNADAARWRLRELSQALAQAKPATGEMQVRQQVLVRRLNHAASRRLEGLAARLARFQANLAHLHPHAVLERGYSVVEDARGLVVRDSKVLGLGEPIKITFARGVAGARVTEKH